MIMVIQSMPLQIPGCAAGPNIAVFLCLAAAKGMCVHNSNLRMAISFLKLPTFQPPFSSRWG